jgi:hypothetical protein
MARTHVIQAETIRAGVASRAARSPKRQLEEKVMGGGGGGRGGGLTPGEVERLEQVARDKLRQAAGSQKRNVFLSFVNEDLTDVNLLRGQARNERSDIEFNDWSLQKPFDSKDADYIKRGIRERIRQSSMMLVYVSEKTASSRWVDWEIREALEMGKDVVAVYKGETRPAVLPPVITEKRIKLIPWKMDQVSRVLGGPSEAT